MYKIILVTFCLCTILMSTCKPQDNPKPNTNDSCAILTKLVQTEWYYDSIKGYYIDSVGMFNVWYKHPAFRSCITSMTRADVIRLWGTPVKSIAGHYNIDGDEYHYIVSDPKLGGYSWVEFNFRNNYVSNVRVPAISPDN